MVHIVREFEVPCPQDAAVAYLADFANAVEWDPGTVSCERIGDPGVPVVPGTKWANVSKVLGRETSLEYELTSLAPDGVVLAGHNETASSRDDIGVTAIDDRHSRIRYEATITFKGLARLADPLMSLVFRRIADETVRDMTATLTRVGVQHG
ncbi:MULTISPECIES: SRPBCC family protein [unclassified Knoellia]|uniref:SRPBCC family protein n=1 Tax=Knoellia altitudinis TaxID=3404795 RepID=UPI00360A05BD